ncbi:NAD(P)-dependent alcohol dehydrogenase [Streptomyces sp. NPDC004609]|uniref:NAD(P)-dependent alcohol dehydrogenase n=1 Tax=Streptomyces sp. NPDC004609 TaxID=3364704 RepID=UPI0036A457B7
MRAVVSETYRSPDDLELKEIDRPAAGADDVLVRVRAAGLDQGVWHLVTGLPYLVRVVGFGLRRPRVRVPGADVAGTVEAVGDRVTRFRPGDEVFGTCEGSYAEYARAHQDRLAPKPANLTFEEAAAVPTSAFAALQGLRAGGPPRPGRKVLVIGAGGGVGTFAVQLAKESGARVTGVCSTGKADLVRAVGADEVIDHTREDCTAGPVRYDLILDIAGGRPLGRLRKVLTPRGSLVVIGSEEGGRWFGGVDRTLRAVLLSPFVGQRLRMLVSTPDQGDLRILGRLIEAGKLTPAVDRTYPLAEVSEAIRYLSAGSARGKVVITV